MAKPAKARWREDGLSEYRKEDYKLAERLIKDVRVYGMTNERHGEAIAEVLRPYDERIVKGIVVRFLVEFPELRKTILKALFEDAVGGVDLGQQKLYDHFV